MRIKAVKDNRSRRHIPHSDKKVNNCNMNNNSHEHQHDFGIEKAKHILSEIIRTCNQPENSRKLSQAKAAAGKEMLLIMQNVFPLVMQLQMDVIKSFGFPSNREGLLHFAQIMHELEREDEDIARLRNQIRTIYLPPIPTPIAVNHELRTNGDGEVNGNGGREEKEASGAAGFSDILI